jgi:hypothetical protein
MLSSPAFADGDAGLDPERIERPWWARLFGGRDGD